MTAPISIQLYTVREALAEDFTGTIKRIADIGFVGVETAGFPGTTPAAAKALFDDLGLVVSGAHSPLPLGDKQNEVLDTMAALGSNRLISAFMPPDQYKTVAQIQQVCATLNEAYAVAAANGLTLGVHNHWWEFQQAEGRYPYHIWLEELDPAIFFEVDTYWVTTAGLDAAEVVREFGSRAPLLHIKDGPANTEEPMLAAGQGVMDFPRIIAAGEANTEWLVVELDRCATDMLTAVSQSYSYLTQKGLARGNK
ncbi:MAG: sugar phosphate isomerase/epimerase [Anaerolineales bacterium]|nr:sugar phosphate isomerase/epimerase [Anaerolineales bacterium]